MKPKVKLLSLAVPFTLVLLAIGAAFVVLGIFNEALNWDIFGPKPKAVVRIDGNEHQSFRDYTLGE